MSILNLAVLLLTLSLAAVSPANVQAASTNEFQQLVKAARGEGKLVLWSSTPPTVETPKLVEAFNKRFGMKIEVQQVSMITETFTNRILAGAQANRIEADLGQGAPDTAFVLLEKGMLQDFDWVGVFGQEFPLIKKRVERVGTPFRGKLIDYWHLAYGIGYRTDRVAKGDLPKTWEDLTSPKWKGQVALSATGGAIYHLAVVWGMEKLLDYTRKLKANQPVFASGIPAAAAALESGSANLSVSTIGQVEYLKAKGLPVDWTVPNEIPIAIEHLIIPKGAPHLNLARLWAAWITTEGRPLFEDLSKNGMVWPDEESFLSKKIKELGTKYQFAETKEQDALVLEAKKKIVAIYLGK